MNRSVVVAVACVWAVSATVFAGTGGPTDPRLTKVAKQWEAAFNAKDYAKVAEQYTEDGVVCPPNAPAIRGRAAIQDWAKGMAGAFASITLTPTESTSSGTIAYEAGTYSGTMASGKDTGKYVVVMKRVGDQWLIAHDIFNSDLPPAPPAR